MLEIVLFVRKGVRNTEIRRKFFNLSENVSETPKFVQNELSLNDFYLAFNCVQYETSFNHLQKFHSIVFTFSNESFFLHFSKIILFKYMSRLVTNKANNFNTRATFCFILGITLSIMLE